jgi:hypothetical protein
VRYSMTLVRPLAAFALALGLMAPAADALAGAGAANVDTKIYAGAGCHADVRSNDQTSVDPTTSILRNGWGREVRVTCPIVRDTAGNLEFASVHVLGNVACQVYSRSPQNGITRTINPDLVAIGFPPNGFQFTFLDGAAQVFIPADDSLVLNCVLPPNSAIIQYRVDEIE